MEVCVRPLLLAAAKHSSVVRMRHWWYFHLPHSFQCDGSHPRCWETHRALSFCWGLNKPFGKL